MAERRTLAWIAVVVAGLTIPLGAGPALGQSAEPASPPPATIELPSALFDVPSGEAPAIRWSGDGEGQAGRGRMPFSMFASGSQLDETAAALGMDPATLLGDRGYARGADPDTVYAIDVILDPAITASAWTAMFIPDPGLLTSRWDQVETAPGPVIVDGMVGGLRWATEGLAVEIMPVHGVLDEMVRFVEQLPPNGIPPITDAAAVERGRELAGWVPPFPLTWSGNVMRSPPDAIVPRRLGDLVRPAELQQLSSPGCVDVADLLAFQAEPDQYRPGPRHDVTVTEWLDPSGDASRWVAPVTAAMRSTMDGRGHHVDRRLGPDRLGGRDGIVLKARDGDHLVVIVASGPALTLVSGAARDVDAVLATYPFPDAAGGRPGRGAAATHGGASPVPGCEGVAGT